MSGDHRSDLRRELLAAAARRIETRERRAAARRSAARRARRLLAIAAVAISVLLLGAAVVAVVGPERAAADVFTITERDGTIIVTVDSLIEDPDQAAAELRRAGLDVALVETPVPPSLVGAIVAWTSDFDVHTETNGVRITSFRIPQNGHSPITINYGRPATPGETYGASEVVPDCADYADRPLTDALIDDLRDSYGPEIVWRELGNTRTGLTPDDLPASARIVTILPLSPESVFVSVTDGGPVPAGDGC